MLNQKKWLPPHDIMNQIKKSLTLSGHKTSIALEKEFWKALEIISENKNIDIDKLIEKIDKKERNGSLASAIRVFILKNLWNLIKNESLYAYNVL